MIASNKYIFNARKLQQVKTVMEQWDHFKGLSQKL